MNIILLFLIYLLEMIRFTTQIIYEIYLNKRFIYFFLYFKMAIIVFHIIKSKTSKYKIKSKILIDRFKMITNLSVHKI